MKTIIRHTQLRLAIWAILFGLAIGFLGIGGTAVQANSHVGNDVSIIEQNSMDDVLGGTAVSQAWDTRFHLPGLAHEYCSSFDCLGSVFAVAVDGTDVYVGGNFSFAGATPANNIAKWDGSIWTALGEGVNEPIRAMKIVGDDIYVGGEFTQAGTVSASHIAKWDGSNWSSLGGGLNAIVHDIEFDDDTLYVGGNFTEAGGASANYIAQWDGTQWAAVGVGMDDIVLELAVSGSELYAGGLFTMAGGQLVNHVARWDGNNWNAYGAGVDGPVRAIAISGDNFYIGGEFNSNNIAQWDITSSTWIPVGGGVHNGGFGGEVWDMLFVGTDLYVTGDFHTSGSNPLDSNPNIARWDGSDWTGLGFVSLEGWSLAYSNGDLYLGGAIYSAENIWATGIAKWDGTLWSPLDDGPAKGLNDDAKALAVFGDNVLVGGSFVRAGQTPVDKITSWDGNDLTALGAGVTDIFAAFYDNGRVEDIATIGQNVYVGGFFSGIGGIEANSLAKWDGNQWSDMNGGVLSDPTYAGSVFDMEVVGDELYIAGSFNSVAGVSANSIAKWDGMQWADLGGNLSIAGIYDLEIVGDELYIGGIIQLDGDSTFVNIAHWNGNQWEPMGDGFNDEVYALAVHDGDLYAGGRFTMSGTMAVNHIARWDGTEWLPLGAGVDDKVYALTSHNQLLYVGGAFENAGSTPVSSLAVWDGIQWASVAGGMTGEPSSVVHDILFKGNEMYVAGSFTKTGDVASYHFARLGPSFTENTYLPLVIKP